MPSLKDPRHEQFAQLVASGKGFKESYILTGYKGKGAGQSANRLTREPKVSARIVELRLLAQQIPLASSWLNENYVLQGLKEVVEKAMELGKLSDAVSALGLMGKRLGLFVDRVKPIVQYPEDISSLDDEQRTIVMRWLARMAYPDDPAAAEAALQIPSGREVLCVSEQRELTPTPRMIESGKPGEQRQDQVQGYGVSRSCSWADIEPEQRIRLATEWNTKGPALPEEMKGMSLRERVAWLDRFWPLCEV
jgi:hypothetical protein